MSKLSQEEVWALVKEHLERVNLAPSEWNTGKSVSERIFKFFLMCGCERYKRIRKRLKGKPNAGCTTINRRV